MNQVQFEAAKKRFESYELRAKSPELSVEAAYDAVIAEKVRAERDALPCHWLSNGKWCSLGYPALGYIQASIAWHSSFCWIPHSVEWPVEPS